MGGYEYRESRIFISKEEILMRVTQEEIFKMVLGYLPREHTYINSPFRQDAIPDCYFEWYKGTMWLIDWAEPMPKKRHRDCFNVIQDHFNVSFYESLGVINKHFNLNLLSGHHGDSSEVLKRKEHIIALKKKIKTVHGMPFKARMFNNQGDRQFWSSFQITRSNLIEDEVFPIIWYKVFSKTLKNYVVIRPSTRSYLIGNFKERKKFYTPDKKGKGKWATNCNANDIWGYKDLPLKGKRLIISKSYKDWRVLKNQKVGNIIAFQNEGAYPSQDILNSLLNRFEEIIVFFDNDSAGIKFAKKLVDHINKIFPGKARSIHLRESLQKENISDPSDLLKNKGKEPLTEFLLENKLIV